MSGRRRNALTLVDPLEDMLSRMPATPAPYGAEMTLPSRDVQMGVANPLALGWTAPERFRPMVSPDVARRNENALTTVLGIAGGPATTEWRGLRAFHGSPHDFDRFDMSRIGTGEGAQAYGHGLYFAGNEAVARGYRDTLAAETYRTPSGATWSPDSLLHLNVRTAARRNAGDLDATIARAEQLLTTAAPQTRSLLAADLDVLRSLRAEGGIQPNPGRMYEVNLRVDPNRLLDWDAPLSAHAPEAQRALMNLPGAHRFQPEWTGANLYESAALVPGATRDKAAATVALRNAGIPGIQYLDQGSRGAGAGTRNYVMFDDALIDIIRKYGLAGLGIGLGAGAAGTAEAGQ